MAITWYTTAGQPSDAVGVDGDLNWDTANRITWGPKGRVTAGSWVGTAYSNIGPTGPALLTGTGAPASNYGQNGNGYADLATGQTYSKGNNSWSQVGSIAGPPGDPTLAFQPAAMVNYANAFGPSAAVNGQSIPTTTSPMFFPGTSIPHTFSPKVDSALTGAMVVNYNATGQTVGVFLVDVASGAIVANLGGQAAGALNAYSYPSTQYVLKAGKQYQWSIQRASAAGVAYAAVMPSYLTPSATPSSLSYPSQFIVNTSTTVAKSASIDLSAPGMPSTTIGYYRNAAASFLYYVDITIAGSGQVQFYLYNLVTSANFWTSGTAFYPTLSSTPTTYTYGPFPYSAWPFVPANNYKLSVFAPNGSVTVTSAAATLTVGQ